jgi:cysteine-rich repeat protein
MIRSLVASAAFLLVVASATSHAAEPCHFSQIDAGYPNCGLLLDGTARCWGRTGSSIYPSVPATGAFTSISAGDSHACGLRADGTVACWGRTCAPYVYMNFTVWTCTTFTGTRETPGGEFLQVAAGDTHVCGVRLDGSAECWGGNPDYNQPPAGVLERIEPGFLHSCAIDSGGDVECAGYNQWGNTDEPAPDTTPPIDVFTDLTNGGAHSCALRAGSAECWGWNERGQTNAPGGIFTELSTSAVTSCGLRPDGNVECWGEDGEGEASPPPGPFVHISGLCGLRPDGTAECWGPEAGVAECAICGNGILANNEVCDDSNLVDGDGCDSNCTPTGCGNGIVTAGEDCDDGDLQDNDGCDSDCTIPGPECGNGITENLNDEECDDGNLNDVDTCRNDCTWVPSICGDSIMQIYEQCDDGNTVNNDGCDANCWISAPDCGNGVITSDEECDDGNLMDGDGCDGGCQQECPITPDMEGLSFYPTLKSSISIRDNESDDRDSLTWKWSGTMTFDDFYDIPEFPAARFQICLYPQGGVLAGSARLRGDGGWDNGYFGSGYSDKLLSNAGISKLKLRLSYGRTSKISLKARGAELPDSLLPAAASYTISLCEVTSGVCWSSTFTSGDLAPGSFKAKSSN